MKVGIITFHRALNYGAVLQTYALQTTLHKCAVDSEVIDYRCSRIEGNYRKTWDKSFSYERIKDILIYPQYYTRNKKFLRFISDHIRLSDICYDKHEELQKANEVYDSFITGSDQVWNPLCTEFDTAYFLDFVNNEKKKNSYAASFGFDKIPDQWQNQYQMLLDHFNKISVREQISVEMIQNLLGREVFINIDPSFLLPQEDWKKIARIPKEKDYILVYLLQDSQPLLNFATELSQKTGLKIIYIHSGFKKPIRATYIRSAGPEEFVGYIVNAKYIITNSFHGMAFSIIFHKCFFVGLLKPPSQVNCRLENILDLFHLRNRQIVDGRNDFVNQGIDYIAIEHAIQREREKSVNYLKDVLGLQNE